MLQRLAAPLHLQPQWQPEPVVQANGSARTGKRAVSAQRHTLVSRTPHTYLRVELDDGGVRDAEDLPHAGVTQQRGGGGDGSPGRAGRGMLRGAPELEGAVGGLAARLGWRHEGQQLLGDSCE
jgi:hypothetical protein